MKSEKQSPANDNVNIPMAAALAAGYDPGAESIMEELATPGQAAAFVAEHPRSYYVFGEDRTLPIRRRDAAPAHWMADTSQLERFSGTAQPGEFYVFQLGVYTPHQDLEEVVIGINGLPGTTRCFNAGGTDYLGQTFTKRIDIPKGRVQALWFGIDVPEDATGHHDGQVTLRAANAPDIAVSITLVVSGEPVSDHGDTESTRLSRLRWLDSTIGHDDDRVVAPFTPITRDRNRLSILGRDVTLGENGLPAQITSFFNTHNTAVTRQGTDLLDAPFTLTVETAGGPEIFDFQEVTFTVERAGRVEWCAMGIADDLSLTCEGSLEPEGALSCRCRLRSTEPVDLADVRLEANIPERSAPFFAGLGREGCPRPQTLDWRWDPDLKQDGFWVGGVHAGMRLQLKGANYRAPLVNAYFPFGKLAMPESWHNDGQGGIRLSGEAVAAYSGPRTLQPGEELLFQADWLLTPFKCIDTDAHWADRYYQPIPHDVEEDDPYLRDPALAHSELGANVINIHHNQEQNPAINYPYWDRSFAALQECISKAHENDVRVKVYYTTREITNQLPELWAFNSLNGEIILPGPGKDAAPATNPDGPHPWLVEHLREDFIPAWREVLKGTYEGSLDLAVITTPDSRMDNFFLEGLSYLLKHARIDGIYVDGTSLGRKSFQRARRVLDDANPNALIDMHMWRGEFTYPANGRISPILGNMENLTYFDRLWMGEGCDYDTNPINWLIEISGIPFGLMGDMLQDGGHPWRGMVFGMTSRLGWGQAADPRPLWQAWDDFGMKGTEMVGFWDPDCPVKTGHPGVLATVYRKPGKALIAVASWVDEPVEVVLDIDTGALGITSPTLAAPSIHDFQPAATFGVTDPLRIPPSKGWLLIME